MVIDVPAMTRTCPSCSAPNRIPPARLGDSAKCGRCKGALGRLAEPINIGNEADFDALIAGAKLPVLVDYWAEWCGPCRMVAPEVKKLAQSHAGRLLVAKVDTESLPGVARRFQITGIPTLMLFRDGQEAKRVSGAMPAAQIARTFDLS